MDNQKDISTSKELELAKKQGANLLTPTTSVHGLSEFMVPVVDSVYLSANPEDGDVYPEKQTTETKFRISIQGLRKLAVTAGIIWHSAACKRTDNRKDRNYVSYQCVGGLKKTDGSVFFLKAEYDLDFEIIEQELMEIHRQKSKNWHKSDQEKQAYVDSSVRRDVLFKRKHRLKLAESGAFARVVRAALSLKSAYKKSELAKPFVMVRYVFQPDLSDIETRRQVTAAAIQAMTGIYGGGQPQPLPPPIEVPSEDYEVHDVPPEDEDPPPPDEAPTPETEPEPGTGQQPEEAPTGEEVFESLSAKEQVETLALMAEAKGYAPKQPIKNLGPKDRLSFFAALDQMPDVEKESEDIPF